MVVGLLRPLLCVTPALLLSPFWRRNAILPANPVVLIVGFVLTIAIAWTIGLTADERAQSKKVLSRLLYWRVEQT